MKSLVQKLRPTKLPEVAFYVQDDDQIRKLKSLEYDDAANKRSCSCMQICGHERIVDGRTSFVNKVTAPANRCFDKLFDAVLFVQRRQRLAQRASLINELKCSHGTQYWRMQALRQYPSHVLDVLTMMELVPEDVKCVADLKTSHYRTALQHEPNGLIVESVVKAEFADLIGVTDEDDNE